MTAPSYTYGAAADLDSYHGQGALGGPPEPQSAYPRPPPVYADQPRNLLHSHLPPLDASQPPHWQYSYQGQITPQEYSGADPRGTSNYERVEGKPGYPKAIPSRGPKQRFTPEDDELLKKLKEDFSNPRLSWKQIADFFPDRNSGTLQVRYCTKLKKKDEIRWTEESDRKLSRLIKEDEDSRWKRIAAKMGNGASDQACEARADELNARRLQAQGIDCGD